MTPNTHTIEPGTYLQASGKNTITSSAFKYGSAKAHAPGRATTRAPQRCSSVLLKWSAQAMYECTHTCSKRNVVTCWDNPKKKSPRPKGLGWYFVYFYSMCRAGEANTRHGCSVEDINAMCVSIQTYNRDTNMCRAQNFCSSRPRLARSEMHSASEKVQQETQGQKTPDPRRFLFCIFVWSSLCDRLRRRIAHQTLRWQRTTPGTLQDFLTSALALTPHSSYGRIRALKNWMCLVQTKARWEILRVFFCATTQRP